MPDVVKALVAKAEQIASTMQNRVRILEAARADLERSNAPEVDLQAANVLRERLANFEARIGRNYQCPRCWVRDGTNYTIRAVPSPNQDDVLRCDRCGGDWVVSC
jgi:hypothetical protein